MSRTQVLVLLMACFVGVSVVAYTDHPRQSTLPPLDEFERAGLEVWRRNNCQVCHQVFGYGGFLGPDLTNRVTAETTPEEIAEVVLLGRGRMPRFDLSDEEFDALFAWLDWLDQSGRSQPRRLQPRNSVAAITHFEQLVAAWEEEAGGAAPQDVRAGLGVWNAWSCGTCHRPFAEGDRREPDLSAHAVDRSFEALSVILDEGRGRMPATPLEDGDKRSLQALLEWIAANRAELVEVDLRMIDFEPLKFSEIPWFEYPSVP